MSSTPDNDANDHGRSNPLSLVEAMEAADRIRKILIRDEDPTETNQLVPPGTWQGMAAFGATGLLVMTPLRRSILTLAGPNKAFSGFVDLVVTPVLAVGAAQAGLVMGTLYGSSYYLDRLAAEAATTTKSFTNDLGSTEVLSVRVGDDDKLSYSPTTESLASEREKTVSELCTQVLSLSSSEPSHEPAPSFASWDPRFKTMNSLLNAVRNCRQREN